MKLSGLVVGLLVGAGMASAASLDDEGYPALFVTDAPGTAAAPDAAAAPTVEAAPATVETAPPADPATTEYMATFYDPADGAPPASDAPAGDATGTDGNASVPEAQPADSNSAAPAGDAAAAPAGEPAAEPTVPEVVDPAVAEAREKRREELRSARGPYAGISGGSDHVTLAGIDDGTANGLLVGYRITEMFAAELVLNTADYGTPVANCLLDNVTTALYAAARTGIGPGGVASEAFYLKGRIGALTESLDSVGNCAGVVKNDVLPGVSVGVGARLGAAAIELEYTLIEEDIYRLGWSVMLNF